MSSQSEKSPFFRPSDRRQRPGTHPRARLRPRPNEHDNNKINSSNSSNSSNDDQEHKSTLLGCTSNLINAIVGGGIVGLSYAMKCCGLWSGIALVFLVAILTEKSLRLLVETAKHVHVPSYETVAEAAYGKTGFWFVASSMLIMAYGAMLSYLLIVKDTFSALVGIDPNDSIRRRSILVIVSLLVIFPISCQRDMADLAKTSRINVTFQIIMTCIVVYLSITRIMDDTDMDTTSDTDTLHMDTVMTSVFRPSTIFIGLGILSFAFVCQHPCFIIAGSLDTPTHQRWSIVTKTALSVATILALSIGVSGYIAFGDVTDGNILNNLVTTRSSETAASSKITTVMATSTNEDTATNETTTVDTKTYRLILANTARALLGVTMLFVYPLESFVARHALVVFLFKGRSAHEGNDTTVLDRRDRRYALTATLYILALIPAIIFDELGDVLAITGAIAGSSLSYFAPGIIYLGIHGSRFIQLSTDFFGTTVTVTCDQGNHTTTTTTTTTKTLSPRNNTSSQPSQSQSQSPSMKETIPLYCDSIRISDPKLTTTLEDGQPFLVKTIKMIVYYVTFMPVWLYFARWGKQCLTSHVTQLALQSPHPIRIGNVRFARAKLLVRRQAQPQQQQYGTDHEKGGRIQVVMLKEPKNRNNNNNNIRNAPVDGRHHSQTRKDDYVEDDDMPHTSVETKLIRSDSLPLESNARRIGDGKIVAISGLLIPPTTPSAAANTAAAAAANDDDDTEQPTTTTEDKGNYQSINRQIGSMVRQRQLAEEELALEDDPQMVPPSVWDFVISIFYIMFGVIALIAGLVSIFL